MKVLGIESSCDETALAVLEYRASNDHQIIAERIMSQNLIHVEYGGVVPELAAREHSRNLPLLLNEVLAEARCSLAELDLIGVTIGPGLKGCLLTGLGFAQGLSQAANVELVGVNHIEGHLLAAFLNNPELQFPYLALLVSGGHTQVVAVRKLGQYEILAETIDDAAGEAFDKSAHLLGFQYPGGPQLAKLADSVEQSSFSLPLVMRDQSNYSFSGLKTAISLLIKKQQPLTPELRADLAHGVQKGIIDNLIFKLQKIKKQTGLARVVLTGGVAANRCLRAELSKLFDETYYPDLSHCMDNAGMIAYTAAARKAIGLPAFPTTNVYSRIQNYQL